MHHVTNIGFFLISAHKRAKRACEALLANACIKRKWPGTILMLFSGPVNLVRRDLINQPSSTSLPLEDLRALAVHHLHINCQSKQSRWNRHDFLHNSNQASPRQLVNASAVNQNNQGEIDTISYITANALAYIIWALTMTLVIWMYY